MGRVGSKQERSASIGPLRDALSDSLRADALPAFDMGYCAPLASIASGELLLAKLKARAARL